MNHYTVMMSRLQNHEVITATPWLSPHVILTATACVAINFSTNLPPEWLIERLIEISTATLKL